MFVPKVREVPALLWLGVIGLVWRDRPSRIRTRRHAAADLAAGWLERHGRDQAAQVIWRRLGVW